MATHLPPLYIEVVENPLCANECGALFLMLPAQRFNELAHEDVTETRGEELIDSFGNIERARAHGVKANKRRTISPMAINTLTSISILSSLSSRPKCMCIARRRRPADGVRAEQRGAQEDSRRRARSDQEQLDRAQR